MEKSRKKLAGRLQDLKDAEDKSHFRLYGELITANLYRLKEKSSLAAVEDYTRPGSPVIEIKLDPNLTPLQNANRFFDEYNRAKRATKNLEKLIHESREEVEYLEGLCYIIENCETLQDLGEIRQELQKGGYIKPLKAAAKEKGLPRRSPCLYVPDGFTIYVGRNNNQNDYLTLQACPERRPLAARQGHTGVPCAGTKRGKNSTPLYQAALLAAFHSKARQSSNVPVDYTLAKHVSKPSGARPGYVIYKNQKTLFVTPAREEMERVRHIKDSALQRLDDF